MYLVYTGSGKLLLTTNDLRYADVFAKNGRTRRIFDSETGKECTAGGVIGITLSELLKRDKL